VFSVLVMLVGWCTPTEAAALGAFSVMALAMCYGDMTWKAFVKSLEGALRVTVMAFLVIFGSATFAQVLAFTGASSGLMHWAISFQVTPIQMVFIMIGVIIFLGSFMDPLSKMLLTAPIFFPLAKSLGFDLTWFGLIMLLALEVGYTTPPFGLLLFVMKGVAPPGTTMKDIYLAGMPFIGCVMLLILMVMFYPPLATWLPQISH
jgi:tripartite ATP-independent transporter DctM subunit